jgi:hypothetical protein
VQKLHSGEMVGHHSFRIEESYQNHPRQPIHRGAPQPL